MHPVMLWIFIPLHTTKWPQRTILFISACLHLAQLKYFGSINRHWSIVCRILCSLSENPGEVFTKLFSLFTIVWFQLIEPETFRSEFSKAGIYSFDSTAMKQVKVLQVMHLQKRSAQKSSESVNVMFLFTEHWSHSVPEEYDSGCN